MRNQNVEHIVNEAFGNISSWEKLGIRLIGRPGVSQMVMICTWFLPNYRVISCSASFSCSSFSSGRWTMNCIWAMLMMRLSARRPEQAS